MTSLPSSAVTAAVSTMPAGPTSSTFQPSSPTTMRDAGAPRTETRSVASKPILVAPTS